MFTADKADIRKKILNLLGKQKEEDRLRKSLSIQEKLFATPEFKRSKTILCYASFKGEVETFEIMRQAQKLGKKIALPMTIQKEKTIIPILVNNLEEDLVPGAYGIREPRLDPRHQLRSDQVDLVLVPGVAFDKDNNRLGRGAGYYDRFLSGLPQGTPAIGLAFDFQVVSRLPRQSHDRVLTRVISN